MPSLPARPRLAPHVIARRHVVDGADGVVLHDLATGGAVRIGPREWGLLAAADGTRDLEGIVLAAAREGAHARAEALAGFFAQLHAIGFLADGVEEPAEVERDAIDLEMPLDPLPGFTLACDGSGSCCRFYGTVMFSPVEAARARALLPLVCGGGERHERAFTPEHGSGPTGGSAVAMRDGRCAYLAEDNRCALHAAGGAGAKPIGCATFPTIFTDDGERVRVSVAVECACVLASVDREGGAPLVPEGARARRDLDATLDVVTLPDPLEIAPDRAVRRAEYLAWSRRVASLARTIDVAASLRALAAAIDRDGLDGDAAERAWSSPDPLRARELLPWIEALYRRAAKREREDAAWRSERDLARFTVRWIAGAARELRDPDALDALLRAPSPAARSEDFYVRALLHAHRIVVAPTRPLTVSLRDRAARIVIARALARAYAASAPGELDPACAHPLALVEAALRGHGLDGYALDVAL
jgi:lysine-N-methylase